MSNGYRFRSIPIGAVDQQLSTDAIALYAAIYTSSETNLCGVIYASKERMADLAGFRSFMRSTRLKRVDRAISELGQMVHWWPDKSILFIHGFSMMQAANPNIWIGAMKNASNLPASVAPTVQRSIMSDFQSSVDQERSYFASTLEKLTNLTVTETVNQPLPKPFRTVPETHARVTRLPERPRRPAPETEGTEDTEGTESLSLSTSEVNEREREVV